MNVILNPDRTRKTVVAVDEVTARSPECPIDILETDIFIQDAPPIPDWMHTPTLSEDGLTWYEGNMDAYESDRLEALKRNARNDRTTKLRESDYVVIQAFEEGTPVPAEWKSYRKALRDLPIQAGFPHNINWPKAPIK